MVIMVLVQVHTEVSRCLQPSPVRAGLRGAAAAAVVLLPPGLQLQRRELQAENATLLRRYVRIASSLVMA